MQSIWRIDVSSWFHACGPATEQALEPTDDDTRGTSYSRPSADRRCVLPGSIDLKLERQRLVDK